MDFYELVSDIESSRSNQHRDILTYSFNQSNRNKLEDSFDLKIYDIVSKTYRIAINYKTKRADNEAKLEYHQYGDGGPISFSNTELGIINNLEWTKLPHHLKAHVYDVVWLFTHKHEAAIIAVEEYFKSYRNWFDEENWVQCIDYISRAIELAARINNKKEEFLNEIYNDIVRLNGNDPSFLSISLIELLLAQDYHCDFNTLIPLIDKLISRKVENLSTNFFLERAYHVKADLHKKLKDTVSERGVYIQYADALMREVERLVSVPNGEKPVDNHNWFIAENDIEKAIELYQNHGALEKAETAQKYLVVIQKEAIKHMRTYEIEFDTSEYYKDFCTKYENHDLHDLIWDVVFAFGFQNKQATREEVINNISPISSLFPRKMLGTEGQTEFYLPSLNLNDDNSIQQHMYYMAKENERIQGDTVGKWFIHLFRKHDLQESDLDQIFDNNPIIPIGQENDVKRGVYYGLTGHMSDALDKLAPKVENIIRSLAELCGDLVTCYNPKEGTQKKKTLGKVFAGKKLNESVDENILFTFDGLLQQKAGSNIRNKIGHGLNVEAECYTGDCIYFVMIVLKFCSLYCKDYVAERERYKRKR